MRFPGEWLRTIAEWVCDAHAMRTVIDPFVADLQFDSFAFQERGLVWRDRWLHLRRCATCATLIARHLSVRRTLVPVTALTLAAVLWLLS